MPRIQSVHHVGALRTSDLADDYSVRAHTESCSYHHAYIYFAAAVRTGKSRFHSYEIVYTLKIKFCGILDRDDTFILRDKSGKHVKKSSLAASCTSAQEYGLLILNAFAQKSRSFFAYKALSYQSYDIVRYACELTDRHDRTVRRNRR